MFSVCGRDRRTVPNSSVIFKSHDFVLLKLYKLRLSIAIVSRSDVPVQLFIFNIDLRGHMTFAFYLANYCGWLRRAVVNSGLACYHRIYIFIGFLLSTQN